ncbi:MAG: PAS domain S-box protein [Chlorobi bacterium]|nr:PAS domain S-box protein [Chlorobiota bacterium]
MTEKEKNIKTLKHPENENTELKKQITGKTSFGEINIEIFKEIYDNSETFVFLTRRNNFDIIYANKKIKKLYGKDLEGKKCWEVFEGRQDGPCSFCNCNTGNNSSEKCVNHYSREYYNKKEKKWLLFHDTLFFVDNNEQLRLSVACDIDKHKKMQSENIENTQNFRHIINNINEAILVIQDGKIMFLNKAAERFFGVNFEYLIERKAKDFIYSPFKEKFEETCTKIFEEKTSDKEFFIKIKTGDNKSKDVIAKLEIGKWKGKESILAVLRDITEERISRRELKESKKFYKILFEFSPMPVLIYSEDKVVLFNNAVKKYIKELDLIENIYFPNLLHPDSLPVIDEAMKKIEDGEEYIFVDNIKVYNLKKEILHISLVISRFTYRLKPALIVIIDDITDRVKAEEELRRTIAVKDRFFSIIAHDLRNPFNQILGFSELLKDDSVRRDAARMKRITDYIYLSAENGQKLLENLLHWAKTQTGSIAYNPENFDIYGVISEVADLYKTNAEQKNITLSNNADNECVFFDKEMFKTIVRNLISNAVKFTERGGYIEITTEENGNNIQINITDNGTGMTEEQKEKIFKLDESFSLPGTENEKGTGLGLAVCKEFVEKNGGEIFVKSELGRGSMFSFTAKKCL